MLFYSVLRKELSRNFLATIIIILTIVVTVFLIRVLGMAASGEISPEQIVKILVFMAIGRLPLVFTLALFIAMVASLNRWYRDSEMVIWHGSGISLWAWLVPSFAFAWPILVLNAAAVMLAWPWSNEQMTLLKTQFQQRSDLDRIAPGQFQLSSDGQRVVFIDKNSTQTDDHNVTDVQNLFIARRTPEGREILISARSGHIEHREDGAWLILEKGQRLEAPLHITPPPTTPTPTPTIPTLTLPTSPTSTSTTPTPDPNQISLSQFERYETRIPRLNTVLEYGDDLDIKAVDSLRLINTPTPMAQGEMTWRLGVIWMSLNLVIVAVAVTNINPRRGRSSGYGTALLMFIIYSNLLNMSQTWVAQGRLTPWQSLGWLHGSIMLLALLWLMWRTMLHPKLSMNGLGFFKWKGLS